MHITFETFPFLSPKGNFDKHGVKKKSKEKEAQGNDYNAFLREGFESY